MIPFLFKVFVVTSLVVLSVNFNEDSSIIVPDQNEAEFSPHVNQTILSHLVFGKNDLGEKAYVSLPEMFESMKTFANLPWVLMVGNTGAGKSLAITKLLGYPLKWSCNKTTVCGYEINYDFLNELKEKDVSNYPLSPPPDIGVDGFSKTLYSTFHPDDGFVWVDTPGFLGNRGSEVEVMEDISRELVIRSSKKIQAIGIVVEFASLERGGDFAFAEVLNRVTEWLPDSKIRKSLLFFVLTKVPYEMHEEKSLDTFIEQKIQVYKKNINDLNKRMVPYTKKKDSQSQEEIKELRNQFTLFRDGVELLSLMSKRKVVLNPKENDLVNLRRKVQSFIFDKSPNRRKNYVDGSKQAGIFRFISVNASKRAEYPKYLQNIAKTGRRIINDLSNKKNLVENCNHQLNILESTDRFQSATDKKSSMQKEIKRLENQIVDIKTNITKREKKIQSLKKDLTPVPLAPVERQFQSYYSILPNSVEEIAQLLSLSGQVSALLANLYSKGPMGSWDSILLLTGIQETSIKLKESFDKSRTVTITAVDTSPFPLNEQKPYHWEVYEIIGGQSLPATNVTTTYEFDKTAKKFTLHCLPPFRTYFYQKSYVASVKLYVDKRNAKSTQDRITSLNNQMSEFKEIVKQHQDQINDFKTILSLEDPEQKINQDIIETKEKLKSIKRNYRKLKIQWERSQALFNVLFQSEALLDLLPEDLHVIKLFKKEYNGYVNTLKQQSSSSDNRSEL